MIRNQREPKPREATHAVLAVLTHVVCHTTLTSQRLNGRLFGNAARYRHVVGEDGTGVLSV